MDNVDGWATHSCLPPETPFFTTRPLYPDPTLTPSVQAMSIHCRPPPPQPKPQLAILTPMCHMQVPPQWSTYHGRPGAGLGLGGIWSPLSWELAMEVNVVDMEAEHIPLCGMPLSKICRRSCRFYLPSPLTRLRQDHEGQKKNLQSQLPQKPKRQVLNFKILI